MTTLDRRKFVNLSGGMAGVAAVTGGVVGATLESAPAVAASAKKPLLVKLGCQNGPSTDEHFSFLARYGIKNIVANPEQSDRKRPYATVEELKGLRELAAKHGLSVDMTSCNFMSSGGRPSDIMLGLPGRDQEIENFKINLRNCAEADVPALKYNLAIMPILRSAVIPGRGDTVIHRWRIGEMQNSPLMTVWDGGSLTQGEIHDRPIDTVENWQSVVGKPSAEELWNRIEYFLERVVPAANEYKVRIALHPEDCGVPPEGFHGVPQVLGTIDGLKRFVNTQDSAYHGLAFCQGTISEDLPDPRTQIHEAIHWFGSRKKIFLVHFRNVRGHRDDVVVEIFPDEGDVDMVKAVRSYRDVGYDGMLVPDHTPMGPEGSSPANFAFCYGYIRGLLQSAAEPDAWR
jgi:mannonate dehydratase